MPMRRLLVLLSFLSGSTACWADAPLKVLRYGPVNDQVVDAVTPRGLVQTQSGDLLTTFTDKGDSAIAYARADVHQGEDCKENRMWRCQSTDQGATWTKPVETDIAGIYPVITTLPSGEFVMACGIRDSKVMRRTTSLFTSSDGINWAYRGHPYYSRTNGFPANSATGGSQAMISMGGNTLYIVFYAFDPALPGRDKTYVDGCLLEL